MTIAVPRPVRHDANPLMKDTCPAFNSSAKKHTFADRFDRGKNRPLPD
jgi:hypothetical protein